MVNIIDVEGDFLRQLIDEGYGQEDDSSISEVTIAALSHNEETFTPKPPMQSLDPQRFAHCWEVVDQTKVDSLCGQVIHMRLKKEYKKDAEFFDLKGIELFPAVEPDDLYFMENVEINALRPLKFSYSTVAWTLQLPTHELLEACFEKYRHDHPELNLRPLKVLSSKGIADDMDFIKAYFSGSTVLLSDGKEFVHDQVFHVVRTLNAILSDPAGYYKERERLEKMVQRSYDRIVQIESGKLMSEKEISQLKLMLGALTDLIWAAPNVFSMKLVKDIETVPYEAMIDFWRADERYEKVWLDRINEKIDFNAMRNLWKRSIEMTNPALAQTQVALTG